jgi:DNA-binding beta-propeller fold protein YncE
MKRTGLLLISLFAIPAIFASPAFSQRIVAFTSLGPTYTRGGGIWPTVNPGTNKIYVVDTTASGEIIVVDGTTHAVSTTIPVGTGGSQVRVNSTTNTVYAFNGQSIYVIDGSVDHVVKTIPPVTNDNCLTGIAVDSGANQIIALDPCTKTGYVLDASGNLLKTVSVPLNTMIDYQVNPTNHLLYVVGVSDHEFVVVDLTTGTSTTVSVGNRWPQNVAIDSSLNRFYMADAALASVYVFDGATNALINTFQPPTDPFNVEVNQNTHVISVSDGGQTIYFYHASSLTLDGQVTFPHARSIKAFSVNSTTKRSYVGVLPANALAFIAGPPN